ncbi:MAG TPA: ribosome biogenesis GTPase Der [Candidatus Saccharibacteria bacterium]|nr:ribosome biogenesis GTPase Der [Candidatus Saccharibacteria bacterium]HMR38028.1 ribosome biogenesis GTPase Der [Candidatus Saccharibacteria bacterium]
MASKLPTVAVIGRANAGKSSLFNRLVRSQQAIVAREAGTTRDSVVGKVQYLRRDVLEPSSTGEADPYSEFWLVDTAGLKDPEDEFEAGIQEQIIEATEAADVILVTVDSTEYPSDEDKLVAKKALKSRKPVFLLLNKADLKNSLPADEFRRLGIKNIIRTSAEHNIGISELLDKLADILPAAHDSEPDDIVRIALIGRPNVGKSYLFNTLAGKQQAIVANVAGTTRDLNRVSINYHKQSIELIDTAGIRRQGKQEVGIEKFSVLRTLQAIEESSVCFLLMDVNELNVALDQKLAGMIAEAGKGLVLVVSKWDSVEGKDAYTRDALAPKIAYNFDFVPWAPLIFTSSVTGQNVTKLFDLALDIINRREQPTKTRVLNDLLQKATQKHPPAGLKNTHPKLRYIVQTDTMPPWFVIYGSNLKFVHWSYKRYLERLVRETYNYSGTPIRFSFRDEKQIKMNKERVAKGLEPVTKAYKQAKEAAKLMPPEEEK